MSFFRVILLVMISILLLATSVQADETQLELCFEDQVAYDPFTDRSWVTDYRAAINGGYGFGGPLDYDGSNPGMMGLAAAMNVHGVTGWRIPTRQEYLDIFPHTGDCGAGDCTMFEGQGWSNPPWWNASGAHLSTIECTDGTLAPCGMGAHYGIHGESYEDASQGGVHPIDWYSNNTAWLVQTGNVCPVVAVPSSGLAGRAVLAAVLMGLAVLLMSATVLKHRKFKLPFGSPR